MRVIALFGRGNIGKTSCLGHLINLINLETNGCNYLFEGKDERVTLNYHGKRITVCTWGDNGDEEALNLAMIRQDNPDIAVVATRTKGITVEMVENFCKVENKCQLKWVEKYVASFDDISGQERMNNLQAKQIWDYVQGLIDGQLYYVDSMTAINGEDKYYHVMLLGTETKEDGVARSLSLELYDEDLRYTDTGLQIREDDFVLYRPDSELRFLNGNETEQALSLRQESREVRQQLAENVAQGDSLQSFGRTEPDIRSYHVNVGHGNCSLILSVYGDDYELWMVDCSTYDCIKRRDYSQDLYHCLLDITGKVKRSVGELKISRFLLTHTHFDHYNGLRYLIKQGLVDGNTVIYANLYYDCASPVWTGILKDLGSMNCRFVEPVLRNQIKGVVNIFHPECRIYKSGKPIADCREVKDANDASVVYGIELGNRIMVLPGDLEQKGFDEMTKNGGCSSQLFEADFYVVSHHGSINGHPSRPCLHKGHPLPKPFDCVLKGLEVVILMGRDRAYSGIYNQHVVDDWNGTGKLVYSEKDKMGKKVKFVEIEWTKGVVRYGY